MIKQPEILITRNTFHINDTRRFKSVYSIFKVISSQAMTETPRAMSKMYVRISKSHVIKTLKNRRHKVHGAFFGESQPVSLVFRKLSYSIEMFTSLRSMHEWSQSTKHMQISHDALRVAVQPPLDLMQHSLNHEVATRPGLWLKESDSEQ